MLGLSNEEELAEHNIYETKQECKMTIAKSIRVSLEVFILGPIDIQLLNGESSGAFILWQKQAS